MNARWVYATAALLAGWSGTGTAQSSQVLVIRGAKIFTLAGAPIEKGTVVIRGNKIDVVAANAPAPAGASVIDATGLQVYPGFFHAMGDLGLTEIGQVPVTNDQSELGQFNPHLLASVAVHPASEHIPVARANGITHAVTAPSNNGGISGQASLINLDGWTVDEMLIRPSVGFVMSWPRLSTMDFDMETFTPRPKPLAQAKQEQETAIARLTEWFDAARRYQLAVQNGGSVPRDLRLEALGQAIRGELPLLVSASSAGDIRSAIEYAERQKMKIIIVGGDEAWKVRDLLAAKRVPVILGDPIAGRVAEGANYDVNFVQPSLLSQAGVKFAFTTSEASNVRRLPYAAANAVAYGLPWEEALKAITLYPAQIFGVAEQLGTIEPGKIANLIVTDGDPLLITTQVKHLIINGRETSVESRHSRLYEKYRARPKPTR